MESRKAYVALLTKTSYLPATLVLYESFKRVGSKYPLVIMTTPSLPSESREVLTRQRLKIITVDSLHPPSTHALSSDSDVRFTESWNKLRYVKFVAFSLCDKAHALQGIRSGRIRGTTSYILAVRLTNTSVADRSP